MRTQLFLPPLLLAALIAGCSQPTTSADRQIQSRELVFAQAEAALARRAGGSGGIGFTCTGSSSSVGCACMKGETSAPLSCGGMAELCRNRGEEMACTTTDGMEICSCAFMLREVNPVDDGPATTPGAT